ncbi:hypothetical protein GWI33_004811 [Rhynchophorus ferrugineus]|uniref:Mos1 transposase HTH domain-containing protein n=1 Tax=Rhynchophorus ferrugineus TaxID=354439 RepID=A0A834INW6_RHYFE|nr:hypothetical protein GWI33_004811 [Rhynchophorus ferrugineus]
MDKKKLRVLIKYCFLKGKNIVEAKTWFDAEFPDTARGKSTIKDWYAKFTHREMSTEDGQLNPYFKLLNRPIRHEKNGHIFAVRKVFRPVENGIPREDATAAPFTYGLFGFNRRGNEEKTRVSL